jgi:predicted AAA+ superfamily ATPase
MDTTSERQRQVNPRKVYPVDPGLIPVFDRSGKANLGHALESAVLIELERRRCEIAYVRTANGQEVDFAAKTRDHRTEYIQVCADLSSPEVRERELRPLQETLAKPSRTARLLLTLTTTDASIAIKEAPAGVTVKPAWEWLLSTPG